MNWSFGNFWYLLLLLTVPLLGFVMLRFLKWRNERKNRFAEHRFQEMLFEKKSGFSKIFPILYLLAIIFLILSIVDFLSGKEKVKSLQKMNNIVYVLDVSNSMNAEDVQPDRLEEAKNITIQSLEKLKNAKVGLVVFAGNAVSVMPLTTDYSAAETYINAITSNIIQIQGTDFLKAMETAVQKFKNIPKNSRQIILISDGEDNEGNIAEAIKLAEKEGISVISVGVGTEEGAPVPEYLLGQLMGYKTDLEGETIISKKQTKALKSIAASTGGNYIDGNNLDNAVSQIGAALENKATKTGTYIHSFNSIHYYQYFLAVSLLLFCLIYLFNPKKDFGF
jgi:Ca-activated chloride channel family protein